MAIRNGPLPANHQMTQRRTIQFFRQYVESSCSNEQMETLTILTERHRRKSRKPIQFLSLINHRDIERALYQVIPNRTFVRSDLHKGSKKGGKVVTQMPIMNWISPQQKKLRLEHQAAQTPKNACSARVNILPSFARTPP